MNCHTGIRCIVLFLALAPLASSQSAQPAVVEDIQPGAAESNPTWVTQLGTRVLFAADDGVNGREPWVSDGTVAGTFMLADLEPPGGFGPLEITQFANKGYIFTSSQLWKTDGTSAGTTLLKDFFVANGSPTFLAGAGGALYFAVNDGIVGKELWKTDGTPAGTVLVKDIYPGPSSSFNNEVGVYISASSGPRLYFAADDGTMGRELWESDGTAAGTMPLLNIWPGAPGSNPYFLTAFTGRLWCRADHPSLGTELVWVDLSSTVGKVVDLNTSGSSSPSSLTQFGGNVVFVADNGIHGREPWSVESSTSALTFLGDLNPGPGDSMQTFHQFEVVGSRVYFQADNGTHGREPWSSDGTPGGASMLRDLYAGLNSSNPGQFTKVDGLVLFVADAGGDKELWRSDGTSPGTLPFWEINPSGSADPSWLTTASSRVFLSARDGASGKELFAFSSYLSGSSYCTAGTSALGCKASLLATGVASRSQTDGFSVYTFKAEGQKDGIFFFGANGRQAAPWGNGSSYQCVAPPVIRTPLRNSGGSATKCNGRHELDFNDWMATHPLKAPVTGDIVQMQCWYRDPLNTSNQTTSLSRALEFTLYP